jgi:ADP-ribosylarginine hydrolase
LPIKSDYYGFSVISSFQITQSERERKILIKSDGKEFTFDYDEFYSEKNKSDNNYITIGGSGVTSMLMAYDALLDAGDCWEKLIYYSMLHIGDSDTVGAIAGGLYGAMYEFKNVPEHMLKYLEKKEDLIEFAEKIHKKTH